MAAGRRWAGAEAGAWWLEWFGESGVKALLQARQRAVDGGVVQSAFCAVGHNFDLGTSTRAMCPVMV